MKVARGRPRSKKAQQAVLQAAADLYLDLGYDKTTMEGIAGRAGVSKQTVYRWWGSKAKILLEVLTSEYVRFPVPGPDTTQSLRDDLVAWIRQIADERHNGAATNQIINMVVSIVMAGDQEATPVYQQLIWPLEAAVKKRFVDAANHQKAVFSTDPTFAAELFMSCFLARLIFGESLDEQWVDQLLQAVTTSQ